MQTYSQWHWLSCSHNKSMTIWVRLKVYTIFHWSLHRQFFLNSPPPPPPPSPTICRIQENRLYAFSSCILFISLYNLYTHLSQFVVFLGDVGGYMGLLLGGSIITLFEVVDLFFYQLCPCTRRRAQKRNSDHGPDGNSVHYAETGEHLKSFDNRK